MYRGFKIREVLYVILCNLITMSFMKLNPDLVDEENSQVKVRAVIIKCELSEDLDISLEGEITRFQREELFKHNTLRNCRQKLALTVKALSFPNQIPGDEYIAIDHVLDSHNEKKRLLNPYVIRLRRRLPFQTYKLNKIETVTGIILKCHDLKRTAINDSYHVLRLPRQNINNDWIDGFKTASVLTNDCSNPNQHNYYTNNVVPQVKFKTESAEDDHVQQNDAVSLNNYYDYKIEGRARQTDSLLKLDRNLNYEKSEEKVINTKENDLNLNKNVINNNNELFTIEKNLNSFIFNNSDPRTDKKVLKKEIEESMLINGKIQNGEREFDIYEIDRPELCYNAHVQLFEKFISSDGKTLWNDLTKGVIASISTQNPDWSNQDVNIQYKPVEWLAKDDFTLSSPSLYLLVPLNLNTDAPEEIYGNFLLVPKDDIVTLVDRKEHNIRNVKGFDFHADVKEPHRRVALRTTRALMGNKLKNIKIISRGSDRFLKLPHAQQHRTQIDIEARADDNELVGALGRLTTIVSDSTRSTRSIFSIQVANMGLAAARFRVLIRECTPELSETGTTTSEDVKAHPILLPPRHTQTFRLDHPFTNPVDSAHCTVKLVNDKDDGVAIRDVRVKKDDQCFCVWRCDCVCLSEDPQLLCQTLSDIQLIAAGLYTQKSHHIRSVCYPDVVTLNLFVTFVGVLLALLLLGVVKACLGLILRCVGSCGLQLLLQAPWKLDRYYESSLKSRKVVYDKEGWPIHPDTKQKTVRLISKPMEFTLNIIFFIVLPCLIICDALKKFFTRYHPVERQSDVKYRKSESKKCFSSHDVQSIASRNQNYHGELHRWMSPQAEELSTNIWQKGLMPQAPNLSDRLPLVPKQQRNKTNGESSCVNSEQDDTEFVLMQMQRSKERLVKNQRKPAN